MNMIPCKDCLTLSVCKALRNKHNKPYMGGLFVTILESRCSLLSDFTRDRYINAEGTDPTVEVLRFFPRDKSYDKQQPM